MLRDNNTPAIILLRPQLGENIGAVARAMENFGLSDLRLVAPKNGWPNPRAYDMAVGAAPILDAARIYATEAEAMEGIHLAFATTSRPRDLAKRVVMPDAAAAESHAFTGGRTAFLFGPERTGMTNDELVLADAIITIPTSTENPSLNLSQAAVVVAYEWWKAAGNDRLIPTPQCPAPKAELQGFFDQLETYLDTLNYFRTEDRKPVMWANLRNIFVRAQPSEQEVRTLRGLMRDLYRRRRIESEGK